MESASLPLLPLLAIGAVVMGIVAWLVWRSRAGDATHLGGVHPNRMPGDGERGPQSVEDLVRAGRLIEAIKHVRERTGLGLAEAKARVDFFKAHGRWPERAEAPAEPPPVVQAQGLEDLIRQGSMIQAIKLAREQNPGMDLRTAKELVEVLAARMR
ncbi:MAG: hypothetical protein U0P81_07235 [Holophagaceae bacterium]